LSAFEKSYVTPTEKKPRQRSVQQRNEMEHRPRKHSQLIEAADGASPLQKRDGTNRKLWCGFARFFSEALRQSSILTDS